jgi:hypothetical protein
VLLRHVSSLKGSSSGSTTDTFSGKINKMCTRREIQLIEQFILYYAAATCWSNRVLINWCENYKYAWLGFMWNSDILVSARKWTGYSLNFRLFILRTLIYHYNQEYFCISCRKPTHRTLNWKTDTCCKSGRIFISENTWTSSMNGNFTNTVVITNNIL